MAGSATDGSPRGSVPLAAVLVAFGAAACAQPTASASPAPAKPAKPAPPPKPTLADAQSFVAKTNDELNALWTQAARVEWVMNTYITYDTELLAAKANEDVLAYTSGAIQESAAFDDLTLDEETERQIRLLKVSSALPAPSDPDKRKRLATIASKLTSIYGKGKYCREGEAECRDLGELSKVLATSRDYDELLDAWKGWRTISRPMRPMYEEFVDLANQGAKEIGFDDLSALWRSGYDMPPEAFEAESERLWQQVKPLYEDLHCYVRAKLGKQYGTDKVPAKGRIPAHLLGNMWAQEWMNVYELVKPYQTKSKLDVTKALNAKKYDSLKMVRMAESFFTSLGMDALPKSFWERSMFTKPKDRDVVCHASAWDVDYAGDLRIKMCIKVDEEDLITIHHELGHNYYFMYYNTLPYLYQNGAHDGFHEAIGDALALSVTPAYLKQVGILDSVPKDDKGLINLQLKEALDKVAFLPFGKLIDQWRWDVFSQKVSPSTYNQAWWSLREKYQGVEAPLSRTEDDFDPGAKFHIPANVPYTRYFLARILQFQFHKAMCDAAGHTGPLHECSIYGNAEAGKRLKAMLALGASKPWPQALAVLTGKGEQDAGPLLEYFAPLQGWLKKENANRTCGW